MNFTDYKNLVDRFSAVRVLIVGDIYLDENAYGTVVGVSLEAPVPILEVHERRYNPGAAGNAKAPCRFEVALGIEMKYIANPHYGPVAQLVRAGDS